MIMVSALMYNYCYACYAGLRLVIDCFAPYSNELLYNMI